MEVSSFIADTHQRIAGLAKHLGMGPCGWLLPRRWSGVMFSPADPRDRCAGRPQQHTLAGFPGFHPAEPGTPKQHASLLSFPFLTTSSSSPPPLVFYLTFSPSQMSRHPNSEQCIFIRLKRQEMSQHWWCWVLRHLTLPLMQPRALPPALWTAVCSFTPLQHHVRCDNFRVQNTNEFVPPVNLPVNLLAQIHPYVLMLDWVTLGNRKSSPFKPYFGANLTNLRHKTSTF